MTKEDIQFMKKAILEAKKSISEGGIPIGAVLVENNKIIGSGHIDFYKQIPQSNMLKWIVLKMLVD